MSTNITHAESLSTHQDQRLSIIFEIAKIIATQQDLDTMLTDFLSCVIERLDATDAGVMLLYDTSDERLAIRATVGYDLETLRQLPLDWPEV